MLSLSYFEISQVSSLQDKHNASFLILISQKNEDTSSSFSPQFRIELTSKDRIGLNGFQKQSYEFILYSW